MLLSLIKYFQGYLVVHLTGYSPERFFNLCSNLDILIWDLVYQEDGYTFKITRKGFLSLKPILRKTNTKIQILEKTGFPVKCHQYRKRKLFLTGVFLAFLLLIVLSRYIWMIEINGNLAVTDEVILKFMEQNQIGFLTAKKTIVCEDLEKKMRQEFPSVIWSSIKLEGTKLTIDVQENLLVERDHLEQLDTEKGYDIVANKDATVLSMITRKGTPCVKAGENVKKGDVLVLGRFDIYSDENERIAFHYVTADADILASTRYQYHETFPTTYEEEIPTGKVRKQYGMFLWGKTYLLPALYTPDVPEKETEEILPVRIGENLFLPVQIRRRTYEACQKETIVLTKAQIEEKAAGKFKLFLKKLEEKGIQITDKNVMIEDGGGLCHIKGTVECTEKLGMYQETATQNLEIDKGLELNESN